MKRQPLARSLGPGRERHHSEYLPFAFTQGTRRKIGLEILEQL